MSITTPKVWSILMATVPNRRKEFGILWDEIDRQIRAGKYGGKIEMLGFCDNKTRSVGYKRQALLDIARGRYISFVDDDDAVMESYVRLIMDYLPEEREPDLVVFPILCTIDGGNECTVIPSIQYAPKNGEPLEEYAPGEIRRPPHVLCVWRTEIARKAKFEDNSWDDDFRWSEQLWKHVRVEERIETPLYWWKGRSNERPTVGM